MLVGIMSDSHGQFDAVRTAVELFDHLGAGVLIHCGDVGGTEVFDELAGRTCHFVRGNCDYWEPSITAYWSTLGLKAPTGVPLRVEVDGWRIAVFHGHEPEFRQVTKLTDVDIVLYGHTHERRDGVLGDLRVINPGALHRARPKTVATFNTATGGLDFHEIL